MPVIQISLAVEQNFIACSTAELHVWQTILNLQTGEPSIAEMLHDKDFSPVFLRTLHGRIFMFCSVPWFWLTLLIFYCPINCCSLTSRHNLHFWLSHWQRSTFHSSNFSALHLWRCFQITWISTTAQWLSVNRSTKTQERMKQQYNLFLPL